MAKHYFKQGDTYFKSDSETNELVSVSTNWISKAAAISVDTTNGFDEMIEEWLTEPDGIEIITEEVFEAQRQTIKDYIIENL